MALDSERPRSPRRHGAGADARPEVAGSMQPGGAAAEHLPGMGSCTPSRTAGYGRRRRWCAARLHYPFDPAHQPRRREEHPRSGLGQDLRGGTVVADMGPQNLSQSLIRVWPPTRSYVPIEKTIREWLASYVYMPRLRDDATLDRALERLIKDLAEPYVFASGFDEDAGTYTGAIEGIVRVDSLRKGLPVVREAIPPAYGSDPPRDDGSGGEKPSKKG